MKNRVRLIFLFSFFAFLFGLRGAPVWTITHWLFDYKFGFVKRGLIGSLISFLNPHPTLRFLFITAYIVQAVVLILLLFYSTDFLKKDKDMAPLLFVIFFLGSSATIQRLNWDFGRFDHIGIIVLLFLLYIFKLKQPFLKWIAVPLCILGILVHESFFLMFFPFILAIATYSLRKIPKQKFTITLAIIVSIAFIAILVFAGISPPDKAEYLAYLTTKTDFDIPQDNPVNILYIGFKDNVKMTLGRLFTKATLVQHILLAVWQLPTLIVLFFVVRSLYQVAKKMKEQTYFVFMLIGAASPLALYPIGFDFYRWIAIALLNIFLLIFFLSQEEIYFQGVKNAIAQLKPLLLICIAVNIFAGPIGIDGYSLPSHFPFPGRMILNLF